MKKMLFLGGIMQQIPAIKRARELGYYVVTCDYLPDNPGHKYANEYHNVSTTDLDGVLALAKELQIDGIVAYASDPAAPTAAYVAEKMGLPGNPYESVKLLTEKDLFRQHLLSHGFNSPQAGGYTSYDEACADIGRFKFPVMVKPVDSSGSKGVVKIYSVCELKKAVEEALSYSRAKRFIVEEFIEKKGYQVSGDGFSVDGKLVFTSYGNELYSGNGTREYVALGEFWPSLLTQEQKNKVDAELQRLITSLGMRTCAYNIEVILDKDDNVYILELGPRNGGSYIPQLINYATGVDLVDATLKAAMGDEIPQLEMTETKNIVSNYMIYSTKAGKFKCIEFNPTFEKKNLLEVHCTASSGDDVHAYQNTSHSLGTILFKASSLDEMMRLTSGMQNCYQVVLQNDNVRVDTTVSVSIRVGDIDASDLYSYFEMMSDECDPPLRSFVNLHEYAEKLVDKGIVIQLIDSSSGIDTLVGIIAGYFNDLETKTAFISQFHVNARHRRNGHGRELMDKAVEIARNCGFKAIKLMVNDTNEDALRFYIRYGFIVSGYTKSQKELKYNL